MLSEMQESLGPAGSGRKGTSKPPTHKEVCAERNF